MPRSWSRWLEVSPALPFELGVAFCLSCHHKHRFFILERESHRLEHSLNDLNGFDPLIYDGKAESVLACLLDCFESSGRSPALHELRDVYQTLSAAVKAAQKDRARDDPVSSAIFRTMVSTAASLAKSKDLIQ
jgi:hypothetical protein